MGFQLPIVRIMPNTAVDICESMTCIAATDEHFKSLTVVKKLFDQLGQTLIIKESLIAPATALCGSGLAFFLRAVRAGRKLVSMQKKQYYLQLKRLGVQHP